jgi:hypothetical protein
MSDNEKRTKPKYEVPIIIPLGEMAKGSGACSGGYLDTDTCTAGPLAQTACTAGTVAHDGCTAGPQKI